MSAPTKAEIISHLAQATSVSKTDVTAILTELEKYIETTLRSNTPFVLLNLIKCEIKQKRAAPARQGRNPSTGEPLTIPAQAAHNVIKVRPLKRLKDIYPKKR